MKIRWNTTMISVLLLSLCLVLNIPRSLMNISTWKQQYFDWSCMRMGNFLAPFGFANLGIATIGLIILWTSYKKRERLAWFIMLIILLCFEFPTSVLPVLLSVREQNYQWSYLLDLLGLLQYKVAWQCPVFAPVGFDYSIGVICVAKGIALSLVHFLVMLVALLLPIKAFFWKQPSI